MIYIVEVSRLGHILITREVYGMDQVERIQAVYHDVPDYHVNFRPDVFRYIELNQNVLLS